MADNVLFESATLRLPHDLARGGDGVYSGQFVGARFHLNGPTVITAIGGDLKGNGTLFGAILAVPGGTPAGRPFDTPPLAVSVFTAPSEYTDLRVPLSLTVPEGDYAVVFGSGWFGATGAAEMHQDNPVVPGGFTFLYSNQQNDWLWIAGHLDGGDFDRYVVEGIPEPSSAALLAGGVAGLLASARCRRNGTSGPPSRCGVAAWWRDAGATLAA